MKKKFYVYEMEDDETGEPVELVLNNKQTAIDLYIQLKKDLGL